MSELYILAAMMSKREPDGSTTVRLCTGYRIAADGEDAVLGRYVRFLTDEFPSESLSGKITCMVVDREHLQLLDGG